MPSVILFLLFGVTTAGWAEHHHLLSTPKTVHWGYYEAAAKPVLRVRSGDSVEIRSAIVFGTALVVMVFLPLFALSGIEGRLRGGCERAAPEVAAEGQGRGHGAAHGATMRAAVGTQQTLQFGTQMEAGVPHGLCHRARVAR